MPKIIGHAEQLQAVKDIKAALKDTKILNEFLETDNPTGKYTISCKGPTGQQITTTIEIPDKEILNNLILAYKQKVGEKVLQIAQNNRIELEEDERTVFGF